MVCEGRGGRGKQVGGAGRGREPSGLPAQVSTVDKKDVLNTKRKPWRQIDW
jgi:hypothetical protein